MEKSQSLSNIQLELLEIYTRNIADEYLLEIKDLLAKYFAKKAREEMNKVWKEKGWTNDTMDEFLKEHMRTPYKP